MKRPPSDTEEDDYMSMSFADPSPPPKKQLTYAEKRKRDLAESQRKGTVKSAKER
ncbi:hypothetical protein HDU98_010517, partial [Podochytrium sp. JEL0797]